MTRRTPPKRRVRYAVIGIGHIAQVAVLPAFAHAQNSELVAIVSDDAQKRRELAERYGLERAFDYDDLEDLFERGDVDAAYIALPNHMHHEFTIRCTNAGMHVLCEKPLAVSSAECQEMIAAADTAGVKLMTAYRLHFEKANLKAIEIVKQRRLGEPRIFNSVFTMQVRPGNVRLDKEAGGGTLYDIGIYCINAVRNLFQAEPEAVQAWTIRSDDERFEEVDEATSAVLHFPNERLAAFTSSFGAVPVGYFHILGTQGDLCVDPAYEYTESLKHILTIEGKTTRQTFPRRDQFAPELIHFSDCILKNREPEPSGEEGLADVRVIEALYRSAKSGERIQLAPFERKRRPSPSQETRRPPVKKPELIHAASASQD